ncbi:ArgE/DapE family deacylase [Synoicihabitans lomoniglobus]|uniref:Probable succinyl-diaminopimelate desuccinylase n=2 Tax=Synoicihabitans lomoniglobus TaxID=2909285 RepID=A0AAE9ZUI9_9BACT|nr:ArgE/DapE family deacylase [Opitutaceae bacterium LMO-M01]
MTEPTPAHYIEQHRSELLDLLATLVRFDTTNPPGTNYDAITQHLVAEMQRAGLTAERLPIPRAALETALPQDQWDFPRFNVVGRREVAGATKTIHFNAHYDVVPVSGRWRHGDPFSGTVDDEAIYGRGTADMKGSIASLLMALRALQETGVEPAVNIEVSFTADEETDSVLGADWLVHHAKIAPDYVVVMEGGEGRHVCCGHNGVTWLRVVVHGKAAHGSQPEHGINALEKMSALVLALEGHKHDLATRTFTTPNGTVMRPTLNVGGVFGAGPGGKINTVPAEAHFTIDRRVLATETVDAAEAELRAVLDRTAASIPDCRITIEKISENHACFNPPDNPFFKAMAESVTKVRGETAEFSVSTGFNDMHFFSHHFQVPTLGYGPGGDQIHAVDEHARVRDLMDSAGIYADLLVKFAG